MRIQISGPNAATLAAELQRHLDEAGLSHRTTDKPTIVTRDTGVVLGIISLIIALPGAINAAQQVAERRQAKMKDKLAQQAVVEALKRRIDALEAAHPGTHVLAAKDDGELWQWR